MGSASLLACDPVSSKSFTQQNCFCGGFNSLASLKKPLSPILTRGKGGGKKERARHLAGVRQSWDRAPEIKNLIQSHSCLTDELYSKSLLLIFPVC